MLENSKLHLVDKNIQDRKKQKVESGEMSWRTFLEEVDGPNTQLIFTDEVFKNLKTIYNEEKKKTGGITKLFVEEIKQIRRGLV